MYLLVLPSLSTGESQWAQYEGSWGGEHRCSESMPNMDEKKSLNSWVNEVKVNENISLKMKGNTACVGGIFPLKG